MSKPSVFLNLFQDPEIGKKHYLDAEMNSARHVVSSVFVEFVPLAGASLKV